METAGQLELRSISVRVYGLVQGVNYRRFTQEAAQKLGVRGWVQNEADGSVSALIQHESRAVLERLLELMREGPWLAEVERMDSEVLESAERLENGFSIRR